MMKPLKILLIICTIFCMSFVAKAQYIPAYGDYVRTKQFATDYFFMMQFTDPTGLPSFPENYGTYYYLSGRRVQFLTYQLGYSETNGRPLAYALLKIPGTNYTFTWPLYYDAGFGTYWNYLEASPNP